MKRTIAALSIALAAVTLSEVPGVHADYSLVRAWEGQTFFEGWEFYGYYDNLTNVSSFLSDQRMILNPNRRETRFG